MMFAEKASYVAGSVQPPRKWIPAFARMTNEARGVLWEYA